MSHYQVFVKKQTEAVEIEAEFASTANKKRILVFYKDKTYQYPIAEFKNWKYYIKHK